MPEIDPVAVFIALLVLVFSLTVHEAAHAWSASRLGDDTARRQGRVSLNPAVHVDPIGTLVLPLIAMVSHAPMIGWARPTPVNVANLGSPRRDHIIVTAAGPLSNLVLAVAAAAMLRVMPATAAVEGFDLVGPLTVIATQALLLNVLLAVFNMLPVPPLDGGQILMALLPRSVAWRLSFLYEYGFLILLAMLVLGVLEVLILPPYYQILSWLR